MHFVPRTRTRRFFMKRVSHYNPRPKGERDLATQNVVRWSPEELRRRRAEGGDLLVLDVRTGDARVVHPHQIPEARWLPLADVVQHADELPRQATIVTYCT